MDTDEVSHMLFATGASFSSLLATHPPLIQRIKALEPNFDESEIDRLAELMVGQVQNGSEVTRRLSENKALNQATLIGFREI